MYKDKLIFIGLILLIVALLGCGGFEQIGQSSKLLQTPPEGQEVSTTQVVVALKPISRGEEFLADTVGYRDWPINNIPPDTVFDKNEAIGQVSGVDIVQGQLIVRSMFIAPPPVNTITDSTSEQEFRRAWQFVNIYAFFFLAIAIVQIVSRFWTVYEERRLTRLEGTTKRGVKIWAEPIDQGMLEFLRAIPRTVRLQEKFIYKDGKGVLIGEPRRFFFPRGIYVGYVDLSTSENQLEYRAAISHLISIIATIVMLLAVVGGFLVWFSIAGLFELALLGSVFSLFILVIFAAGVFVRHYRDRKRLLNILNQAKNEVKVSI